MPPLPVPTHAPGGADNRTISDVEHDTDFKITLNKFRRYLPLACLWVVEQERLILEQGIPLTASQLSDAGLAGVVRPDRVRLLRVERIPFPEDRELRAMAEAMKLTSPPTPGLALRYGIYIRSEYWGQRRQVVHELAHTAQYERLGSIPAFLECYLYQCLAIGYPSAPMEQEATAVAQRICGRSSSLPMPKIPSPHPSATRRPSSQTGATNQTGDV